MQLNYIPHWFSGDLAKALSWTLIHSLWLGLIAALIAGLIVNCTKHSKAQVRYNLLSAIFAIFAIASGISFFVEYANLKQSPSVSSWNGSSFNNVLYPPGIAEVGISSDATSYYNQFVYFFNDNASIVAVIWFLFFLIRSAKLVKGIGEVYRLATVDVHVPSQSWIKRISDLKEKLGIAKNVGLLETRRIKMPMTLGFLKPTILVPIGLLANLPSDQVESILLHELAHIKRKDYMVNFLQRILETLLFFNPAVLWISGLIREEREACCDDIVVENLTQTRSYLQALVSFQDYAMGTGAYTMALAGRRDFLLSRVTRLVTGENKNLSMAEKLVLLLSVVIITAFSFIKQEPNELKQNMLVQDMNSVQGTKMIPSPTPDLANKYLADVQGTRDTTPVKTGLKRNWSGQRREFTRVQFDKTNDPKVPVHTYEIIDKDAHVYRITRENGQLVALLIDNKQIPFVQLTNYQPLFESAEDFIRVKSAQKRARITDRTNSTSAEKGLVKNKNKRDIIEENGRKRGDTNSDGNQNPNAPGPIKPEKRRQITRDKDYLKNADRIKGVLEDLVKEQVVANTSVVEWFAINDDKMMVNGKVVSEVLHGRLKSKYGIEKNYGLFYGPSEMHGPGVYFDREDLD